MSECSPPIAPVSAGRRSPTHYGVIALAGQLDEPQDGSEFFALPVFTAWVAVPQEADADR